MLRRSLAALMLISLAALPFGAAHAAGDATAARKYPPYPEVWGRVLPFPNDGSYYVGSYAYEAPDGQILFLIYSVPNYRARKESFDILNFFEGRLRKIDEKAKTRFRTDGRHRELPRLPSDWPKTYWPKWPTPDGGTFEYASEAFSNCRESWDRHFIRRDRNGKIIADKMLLALYDRPVRVGIMRRCALSEGADHYFAKWQQLEGRFSRLADGTVLYYGSDAPFIIRFRPDLTSPFVAEHPKLFLVDRAAILKVVEQGLNRPGLPLQNVDDAVYDYLLTLRKEKTDAK